MKRRYQCFGGPFDGGVAEIDDLVAPTVMVNGDDVPEWLTPGNLSTSRSKNHWPGGSRMTRAKYSESRRGLEYVWPNTKR